MKHFFKVLLTVAICGTRGTHTAGAERLDIRNGEVKESPFFEYSGAAFRSADGTVIARRRTSDWWIDSEAVAAVTGDHSAVTTAGDESVAALRERLENLRSAGDDLAARFPGCGGVLLIDDGRYVLTADRRHVYRYVFAGLILNESRLDWSRIALWYTEGRSRQRILYGRCLTRDRRLIVLDPADVTVSTPAAGLSAMSQK